MRKFATLYITPILGVIIILIKIPEVDKWIRANYEDAPFIIVALLAGATILTHLITVISPVKKYEKLEANRWVLTDRIVPQIIGNGTFHGFPVIVNLMMPKRVFYANLEPAHGRNKIKCFFGSFFKKMLIPVYLSKGSTLNKDFKITVNQGVSGRVFKKGTPLIVQDISKAINDFNLTQKQISTISGQGFIAAYPVFKYDEKYKRLSNKIIGVVTFSCSKLGSEKLMEIEENRNLLTEKMDEFANVCSLII